MQTLLTYEQQLELVKKKLAVVSRNEELGLDTFKYHRRVMYDYLWAKHPEVMECRGHTYDYKTGEIVLAAPRKSFNYLEDGYWKDKPLSTEVHMYKKWNGFMATMSVYNGELIVGTTGSTKSEYAQWAKQEILKNYPAAPEWHRNGKSEGTWLFEICVNQDPHIVKENIGAHYLGFRNVNGIHYEPGEYTPVGGFKTVTTLEEAIKIAEEYKGEGFMIYDSNGECCKLKSPYYVGKKKLMRMKDSAITKLWTTGKVDGLPEMWQNVSHDLVRTYSGNYWLELHEQDRRKVLEDLFGN